MNIIASALPSRSESSEAIDCCTNKHHVRQNVSPADMVISKLITSISSAQNS
jgi:hypothetical protein